MHDRYAPGHLWDVFLSKQPEWRLPAEKLFDRPFRTRGVLYLPDREILDLYEGAFHRHYLRLSLIEVRIRMRLLQCLEISDCDIRVAALSSDNSARASRNTGTPLSAVFHNSQKASNSFRAGAI